MAIDNKPPSTSSLRATVTGENWIIRNAAALYLATPALSLNPTRIVRHLLTLEKEPAYRKGSAKQIVTRQARQVLRVGKRLAVT